MNRNELMQGINETHLSLWASMKDVPVTTLARSANGKWSVVQNVDHINKCLIMLVKYMSANKEKLAANYGLSGRQSMPANEVRAKYVSALANGGVSTAAYLPEDGAALLPDVLTQMGKGALSMMNEVYEKWTDAEMDDYICPHPLIGNITLKEMLYFTIDHVRHHHETVKRLVG